MASTTHDLPVHPSQLHPLTGMPLRALYVDRHGRPRYPIMGGAPDGDESDDKKSDDAKPEDKQSQDTGFPANTPLEQMSGEQREAYWKHQARKHEQRTKDLGNLTPDQLKELREKAARQDELENELATDKEKAVREARTTAEREKDERYQPLLAETAFRVAIGDRKTEDQVTEFLGDLNLKSFINEDGTVNTAKVLTRAGEFAPVTGTQQSRKGPTVTGHGSRTGSSSQNAGGGSVAERMAEIRAAREAKKTPSTS